MPAPGKSRLTSSAVTDRLANLMKSFGDATPLRIPPSVWPYYKAAAVLPSFTPGELEPVGTAEGTKRDALRSLVGDCAMELGDGGVAWSLRSDVRRLVLRQMGSEEIEQALATGPVSDERFASAMRAVVLGHTAGEELKDLTDVQNALTASEWLGSGEEVRQELRKRLELLELLQPFHDLVGTHFRGRESELDRLTNFVGVTSKSFTAAVLRVVSGTVLSVVGPGGVGKSTLIARFILDHAETVAAGDLAFAYLDADRLTVPIEDPIALASEAIRQLAIQFPHIDMRNEQQLLQSLDDSEHSSKSAADIRKVSVQQLAAVLTRIGRPFLLVLDTFEEILYRSSEFVSAIGLFVNELCSAYGKARTVIGSRAPITQFRSQEIALSALDEKAAIGFLRYRGIPDDALAKSIYSQLGGNPLTLRLAADVVRSDAETNGPLTSISTRNFLFLRLEDQVVQGQLYRRILNHIQDADVRALAHPGLVVRRITPAVIQKVLAEPCGLKIDSAQAARELFRKLEKEVSLVEKDGEEALRHRGDVRRVMLKLLIADTPDKVATIHGNAVEFYRNERGTRARAEEIYHRLMLEQSAETIDKRWRDELQSYLANSYEELPPASRAYLATKLGYEIDEATRKAVDTVVWERAAIAKAQDLLSLDDPERALAVLRERKERSQSSLIYDLEVQALQALEQYDEAVSVVVSALPAMRSAAGAVRFLALAERGAEMAELANQPERAVALLESAAAVARTSAEPVVRLRFAVRLLTLRNDISPAPRHADEEELMTLYRNTPIGELIANEAVAFAVAAFIADRVPGSLMTAVELSNRARWTRRMLAKLRKLAEWALDRLPVGETVTEGLDELDELPLTQRGTRVRRLLSKWIDMRLPTGTVALELAAIIQEASLEPPDADAEDEVEPKKKKAPPRRSTPIYSKRSRSTSRRRLK
ncbi:MAG TPA: AAA family ATPase [Thermoanaerobaculia bacterium]|nr:AAA family ATPase [Thermoanaerobaculia bacterium]